jgi:hypothetical protein
MCCRSGAHEQAGGFVLAATGVIEGACRHLPELRRLPGQLRLPAINVRQHQRHPWRAVREAVQAR